MSEVLELPVSPEEVTWVRWKVLLNVDLTYSTVFQAVGMGATFEGTFTVAAQHEVGVIAGSAAQASQRALEGLPNGFGKANRDDLVLVDTDAPWPRLPTSLGPSPI